MQSGLSRYEPLYLKHRPQSLNDLVGQSSVVKTLANAIEHNKLVHAYLFTGPRGTGKTSTARILAKSLNCESGPTVEPCLKCTQCLEIKDSKSPAVFEIDAASNNSVDDARVLIERAPLVAVSGRNKIYIIDECHMLTREAFNALLKTIEEPPPGVLFVLATTEEHKVPPTIVSRCQKLMFRLVHQDELSHYLRKIADSNDIQIEDAALSLIARRSGGGLRDALGLLDQASLLSSADKTVTVNDLLMLLGALNEDMLLDISRRVAERKGDFVLAAVNQLLEEGREPAVVAIELARHFLNLTKSTYLANGLVNRTQVDVDTLESHIIGSKDYIKALCDQALLFDLSELTQIVEQLNHLEQICRRSTQPALQLEMGLLALCHRHDIQMVKDLDLRINQLELAIKAGREPVLPKEISSTAKVQARPALDGTVKSPVPQFPKTPSQIDAQSVTEQPRLESQNMVPASLQSESESQHTVSASLQSESESQHTVSASLKSESKPHDSVDSPHEATSDLDEFWSDLLQDLQTVSPSIHAVMSTFPVPISLDVREFVIGVPNDMWKNNVEKRLEPIKAACQRVLGREISVRVIRVNETAAVVSARTNKVMNAAVGQQSAFVKESVGVAAAPVPDAALDKEVKEQSVVSNSYTNESVIKPNESIKPNDSVVSGTVQTESAAMRSADSTAVREAYQLFEGPGSRLIG